MNHVNYVYRTSDEVDWSLAPDWANFYTIDSDSERWWFENRPTSDISPFGVLYWVAGLMHIATIHNMQNCLNY